MYLQKVGMDHNFGLLGGALHARAAHVEMEACLLTENVALVAGGAVAAASSNLVVKATLVRGNTAPAGSALFIYLQSGACALRCGWRGYSMYHCTSIRI